MRYFLFSSFFIFPWLVVMLLRIFGPLTFPGVAESMNQYLALFFTVLMFSFTFGYVLFSYRKQVTPSVNPASGIVFNRARLFIFALAIAFPIINGYDFFVVKGASLGEIVELREMENAKGARNSLIGAFVVFLSATPAIALVFELLAPSKNIMLRLTIWAFVVLGFGCMFLNGGRNAFFLSVVFVSIFAGLNFKLVMKNLSLVAKIIGITLVLLGVVYSFYIFIARFNVTGLGEENMLRFLSFFYGVTVEPLPTEYSEFEGIYGAWIWFIFYLCHPLGYLQEYFTLAYEPNFMGAYSLSVYARVIDFLFGTSYFIDAQNGLIKKGIYLTLPGSLYVDFGYIGSLYFIACMGGALGVFCARVNFLHIIGKLWLSYLIVLFIFSPFYNAASMGNGISFLTLLSIMTAFKIRWIGKA